MKEPIPVIFLVLPAILCFLSMDWPSPQGRMVKNFGWNEGGLPHLGIVFEGTESLGAAEGGELLYRRQEGDTASRLPSPLGSWAAIDHGDGIISIYGRFKDEDESAPELPRLLERGGYLGESGISGWSQRSGVFFQLFDRKERRWINPAMIIAPPPDIRPPVITSIRLRDEQGTLIDPSVTRNLRQGRYVIIVQAVDTMLTANESPLAPYRIICSLNGSEAGVLNFETYSARDGVLMVFRNGLVPVRRVYAPAAAYEVADVWFTRGQTTLEVIAQDIAGNARNVVYRLMVE